MLHTLFREDGFIDSRKLGRVYEEKAENYFIEHGYRILERNYQWRYGEIDLIVMDDEGTIVFVEVKGRSNHKYGYASEAVTIPKQRKIIKTARRYMWIKGFSWNHGCRFDVIAIDQNHLEHIENAFFINERFG